MSRRKKYTVTDESNPNGQAPSREQQGSWLCGLSMKRFKDFLLFSTSGTSFAIHLEEWLAGATLSEEERAQVQSETSKRYVHAPFDLSKHGTPKNKNDKLKGEMEEIEADIERLKEELRNIEDSILVLKRQHMDYVASGKAKEARLVLKQFLETEASATLAKDSIANLEIQKIRRQRRKVTNISMKAIGKFAEDANNEYGGGRVDELQNEVENNLADLDTAEQKNDKLNEFLSSPVNPKGEEIAEEDIEEIINRLYAISDPNVPPYIPTPPEPLEPPVAIAVMQHTPSPQNHKPRQTPPLMTTVTLPSVPLSGFGGPPKSSTTQAAKYLSKGSTKTQQPMLANV